MGPHLALLLQNASSPEQQEGAGCDLGVEDGVIGVVARSGGGLGLGVVSAVVGGSQGNHRGWIIALFTTVNQQLNPSLQEWSFHNASCWFELQEGLAVDNLFPPVN